MERFRFPSKSQFNDPISPPVVITQPLMINKVNADWNGMITMYRNKRSQILIYRCGVSLRLFPTARQRFEMNAVATFLSITRKIEIPECFQLRALPVHNGSTPAVSVI